MKFSANKLVSAAEGLWALDFRSVHWLLCLIVVSAFIKAFIALIKYLG